MAILHHLDTAEQVNPELVNFLEQKLGARGEVA